MKFETLLKKLRLYSNHEQHQVSCVIANKSNVISLGYNQLKTHTQSTHPYRSLHAEMAALIGLPYEQTKGCTAYVYRETKAGVKGLSKPCPACMLALKTAGIRKVVYSTHNSFEEIKVA